MIDPSATLELTSSSTRIGDVEDHDELINDLSINIGDLRIDLIVDLLLAYGSACYPANRPVSQQGRSFTKQCNLTYAEQ
jgi:hypothetical protein